MARTTGENIRCGPRKWLVPIYVGRDPETRKRKYIGKSTRGGLRDSQAKLRVAICGRSQGIWFGTRGSEVQILSPRPIKSITYSHFRDRQKSRCRRFCSRSNPQGSTSGFATARPYAFPHRRIRLTTNSIPACSFDCGPLGLCWERHRAMAATATPTPERWMRFSFKSRGKIASAFCGKVQLSL